MRDERSSYKYISSCPLAVLFGLYHDTILGAVFPLKVPRIIRDVISLTSFNDFPAMARKWHTSLSKERRPEPKK